MKRLILIVVIAIVAATSAASAAPSVTGPTGLIDTPSASMLREGQVSLGYYHLNHSGAGVFNTSLSGNLELGVAGFRYDGGHNNKTMVNAKLSLVPETILSPGFAVGIEDAANMDKRSVYAVASKGLPFGFRLHVGAGNGRFDGMFAALEKTIKPAGAMTGNNTFPATTLLAEFNGKTMNYGARVAIASGVKFDAGWRDHKAYFGISFTQ